MLNKPSQNATQGEQSFFRRLENYLSKNSDIIGYYEPHLGGYRPDFIMLSPLYGIIIVEIKDYFSKKLLNITETGQWEYFKDNMIRCIDNPFDQLYQYWRIIKDRIGFCHYPNHINIPIIQVAVFAQISEEDPISDKIRKLTPEKVFLCFKENISNYKNFEDYFKDVLPIDFSLSQDYFEILRGNIFPMCRLPTLEQADLSKYYNIEDKVKLLDQKQEKLAIEFGSGHRLVFGVAGGGKTILLISRARILAEKHPKWKILIICYNKLLRDLIYHLIKPQNYTTDITINTYHGWVRHYINSANNEFWKLYKGAQRKAEKEGKMTDFFHKVAPKLFLHMLEDLGENKILYDAILIDEGQDFEQEWFEGIIKVLNPTTNSLLITCDGLQGIYARKRFHWSNVGIEARGRVKRFEKSYRNPIEIGIIAQRILPTSLRNLIGKFDEFLSTKEFLGNHGLVEFIVSDTREDEYKKLAIKINQLLKNSKKILLLFKRNMVKNGYNHPFFKFLKELNLEWSSLEKLNPNTSGLLIGTIHGTKGLEFDTIIIPEIDTYKTDKDRQLLYVGVTRSRKKLILSANQSNGTSELLSTIKTLQT
ncbi:MAG: ATP-binding domain-containing protein [Candidatus Lokiarchaeota archaeon]|nr:ATP-binding domain-containing protein [Candidatus Lokiarchaeota archaeon]